MLRRVLIVLAVASVAAVATACTPTASPAASPGAGSTPSPAAVASASGSPLYGTYTATLPDGLNAAPGTWTLSIGPSGANFTHPDGHTFSPGAVQELTATEVVFAADAQCPVQSGTPTPGRYRWARAGATLTLDVVSDSCGDRIDTLTPSDWSVKP